MAKCHWVTVKHLTCKNSSPEKKRLRTTGIDHVTHRLGSTAILFLLSLTCSVTVTFTRRRHTHQVIVTAQTPIATRAVVVHRLQHTKTKKTLISLILKAGIHNTRRFKKKTWHHKLVDFVDKKKNWASYTYTERLRITHYDYNKLTQKHAYLLKLFVSQSVKLPIPLSGC